MGDLGDMDSKKKRIFIGLTAFTAFIAIALSVMNNMRYEEIPRFDSVIRSGILNLRSDLLTPIVKAVTGLGNSETIIILCVILILWRRTRFEIGLPVSCTALFTVAVQTFFKNLIERPRPPVESFLIPQGGFSFPSGHSCSSLVFYGFLVYLLIHKTVDKSVNKFIILLLLLPLMIGISRIYLGVHYPTDVLAGWCLGLCILTIAVPVLEAIKEKKNERMQRYGNDK